MLYIWSLLCNKTRVNVKFDILAKGIEIGCPKIISIAMIDLQFIGLQNLYLRSAYN